MLVKIYVVDGLTEAVLEDGRSIMALENEEEGDLVSRVAEIVDEEYLDTVKFDVVPQSRYNKRSAKELLDLLPKTKNGEKAMVKEALRAKNITKLDKPIKISKVKLEDEYNKAKEALREIKELMNPDKIKAKAEENCRKRENQRQEMSKNVGSEVEFKPYKSSKVIHGVIVGLSRDHKSVTENISYKIESGSRLYTKKPSECKLI